MNFSDSAARGLTHRLSLWLAYSCLGFYPLALIAWVWRNLSPGNFDSLTLFVFCILVAASLAVLYVSHLGDPWFNFVFVAISWPGAFMLSEQLKNMAPVVTTSAWAVALLIANFAPSSDKQKRIQSQGAITGDQDEGLSQFVARKARFGFDKIVGMEDLKTKLSKIGAEVVPPSKKRGVNTDVRNGVLLFGEPGNGKTFIAEAFAGEIGLPFIELRYGDVASRWVNQTTEGVRAAFEAAKRQAPCVLFIDEVDSFIEDRNQATGGGESVRTTNSILTALVDIRGQGVVVMAATNFLDRLDAAAIREGRFDYKVEVPCPDLPARKAILLNSLTKRSISVDTETLDRVCSRWGGFSAARINTIGVELADMLKERQETVATFDLLSEALRRVQGHKGRLPEDTPELSAVALGKASRDRLAAISMRMKNVEKIEQLGGTVPSGILFYGPPGTGKTLTVRALAKTTGWAFLSVTGSDLISKPSRIDEILEDAANLRPCIVFIDEADGVLGDRSAFGNAAQITNKILTAMDGSGGKTPDIVFVAATNHPDNIDDAALRGGRFTEKVLFALPDQETIAHFVKGWMAKSKAKFDPAIDPDQVASVLAGKAMADVVEVMKLAANRMIDRQLSSGVAQSVVLSDIKAALLDINY